MTHFFYTIGQDSNPNNASKARKTKQRKYITGNYSSLGILHYSYVFNLFVLMKVVDFVMTKVSLAIVIRGLRMQT